ncbi:MAG: hypothetical protein QGH60_24935, partial [Phycisphaerae bacterium]|nr:hypothetical protein [Phycisphaerae bacterium]
MLKPTENRIWTATLLVCVLTLAASRAGGATAHDSGGDDQYTFGLPDMVSVPDGGAYSGISSTVTGIDNPGA